MYILKDIIHDGKTYKKGTVLSSKIVGELGEIHVARMVRCYVLHDPTGKVDLGRGPKSRFRRLDKILRELGFDKSAEEKPKTEAAAKVEEKPKTENRSKGKDKRKKKPRRSLEDVAGVSK